MKINIKFILTVLFGIAVYVYAGYLFFQKTNFDDLENIVKNTDYFYILIGLVFSALMIYSQGYFLKKIFALYNVKISLKDAIITWLITIPTGVLTAGLSGPAIIFYKAKKTVSSQLAAIITISYFVLNLIINLLFASFAGGISIYTANIDNNQKIILYALVIIFIVFIFLLSNKNIRSKFLNYIEKSFPNFVPRVEWQNIMTPSSSKLISIFLIGMLVILLNLSIFALGFYAYNIFINFSSIIRNFVLQEVISVFSPTSGGLGFVELGLGSSLKLSGLSLAESSLLVIFFRFFNFWIPALIGFYYLSIKGYSVVKKISS